MNVSTLTATIRNESGKKARREGFIPAVIYGKNIQSTPIKFDRKEIIKVLKQNGTRTRILIKLNDEINMGIIKEVDTHPLSFEIQHIDIQKVEKNEMVNWEIPINFTGIEALESKRLFLEASLSQIKVTGEQSQIPDFITIDVGGKNAHDIITIEDLNLDSSIKTAKPSDTILAIVKPAVKNSIVEETEE